MESLPPWHASPDPGAALPRGQSSGTHHQNFSHKLSQEMTTYVRGIHTTFVKITGGDARVLAHLDADTVSTVEGRCPKLFTEDRLLLDRTKHRLFCHLSETERKDAFDRICDIGQVIPSLHTFIEDTKLLEACAKVIKKLLPAACQTSVHQDLNQLHRGQTSWVLQERENTFSRQNETSSAIARRQAYRQLWLYALRHFPEMTGQPLRKDASRPKPPSPSIELIWWYILTKLAVDCGYTGVNRRYFTSREADQKMAEAFLEQVRPRQLHKQESVYKSHQLRAVMRILDQSPNHDADLPNLHDGNGIDTGSDIAYRCGIPHDEAYRYDQQALFLICVDRDTSSGPFLGSLVVKRHAFHRFFGAPDRDMGQGQQMDVDDDQGFYGTFREPEPRREAPEGRTDTNTDLRGPQMPSTSSEPALPPPQTASLSMPVDIPQPQTSANPQPLQLGGPRAPSPMQVEIPQPQLSANPQPLQLEGPRAPSPTQLSETSESPGYEDQVDEFSSTAPATLSSAEAYGGGGSSGLAAQPSGMERSIKPSELASLVAKIYSTSADPQHLIIIQECPEGGDYAIREIPRGDNEALQNFVRPVDLFYFVPQNIDREYWSTRANRRGKRQKMAPSFVIRSMIEIKHDDVLLLGLGTSEKSEVQRRLGLL